MAAAPQNTSAYVGRAAELASLDAVVADIMAGARRVVLLGGDAGIGKTRTAIELADRARERGARALWGRCPETEGAPEFWPWVQILRAWAEGSSATELRRALGSGAEDVARLVPEIGARLALPEPPPLDASQARFRLFDAVAAWARSLAREAPLLLVLDDLHWADAGSLRLLEFAARDVEPARIGLVATFRETELTAEQPLARSVAELSRLPGAVRLALRGLEKGELGDYLTGALGVSAAPGVLAQVHARSEGNPFFAAELMRFLLADPREHEPGARPTRLPPSVRAVVARRVERLGSDARAALEAASVIGREFDLPRLEHATGEGRLELLARLEPALAAGVIESAGGGAGRYRFAHALVRESLYEGLALTRRLELHQRVGKSIEALHVADREEHLAELAYHFCAAAPLGHAEHAVGYAERAAARASERLAFEEAAHLYGRALEALALGDDTPVRRCDLLLRRGTAEHRAGDVRASSETFAQALDLARSLGDAERTVRALLGPGWWLGDIFATPEATDAAVLEGATAALEGDSVLAAEAASVLATRLFWEGRLDDAERESARAAAVARRVGDTRLMARCLDARHWVIGGPDRLAERVALAAELLALAERSGDVEMQCSAHRWHAMNALEQGDRLGFERSVFACESLAERTRQPWFAFQARGLHAVDAVVCGRLDEAEQRASASFESALTSGNLSGALSMGTLLIQVRWLRGDLDGALALAGEGVRRQNPETYVYRAARATLACERGDGADEGRAVLAELTTPGALLRNRNFTGVGVLLARICERLGAVEHAEALLELLAPFADRNGTIGLANVLVLSSVASCLGALATMLGRFEDAERWFEQAIEIESRTGSLAWLALTKLRYAALLARRAEAGDAERARELASETLHAARELGLAQRAREAEAALGSMLEAPPPAAPAPESAAASARAHFRREGDVWSIALDGKTCRLRDSKGLRHLAYLLAHPGKEFHALELAGVGEAPGGSAPDSDAVLDAGNAGPQLDARAKAAYRARLDELAAELAEAERFHDPGRVERAQAEIDAITDELARGIGLGGRDRTAASAAERARQAVTHGVRTALRRIRAELPALGEHLAPRIRTGLYCAYVPDPTRPIEWEL